MELIDFNLEKDKASIIKVLGIGGGGTNAVNHMNAKGITGVNFIVCNTDDQHLNDSPVRNKILLGPELLKGRGTGADPEMGRRATEESLAKIKEELSQNGEMLFIAAAMGKGTGTGGAPVVAKLAKEMNLLTIAIVSSPFSNLGRSAVEKAKEGIAQLKEHVDSMIIVSNDKIREMHGQLKGSEAFALANDVLFNAAKGISEIITKPGEFNTDFNDVKSVMKNGGICIMGVGYSDGEERAKISVKKALESPLLNDGDIRGAKKALVNIATSKENEVTIDEIDEILASIREAARCDIDIIFGSTYDETLGDELGVTIVVTGFNGQEFDAPAAKPIARVEEKIELPHSSNFIIADINTENQIELEIEPTNDSRLESIELYKEEDDIFELIEEKQEEDELERRKRVLNELSLDMNSPLGNPEDDDIQFELGELKLSSGKIDDNGYQIKPNDFKDSKTD